MTLDPLVCKGDIENKSLYMGNLHRFLLSHSQFGGAVNGTFAVPTIFLKAVENAPPFGRE